MAHPNQGISDALNRIARKTGKVFGWGREKDEDRNFKYFLIKVQDDYTTKVASDYMSLAEFKAYLARLEE